jgi:SM-20-related protein
MSAGHYGISPPTPDGQVSVTLLLGGGHSHTLTMHQQEPLLQALLSTLHTKGTGQIQPAHPYRIPLDEGRRSLVFAPGDLVGVITDPPVALEPRVPANPAERAHYAVCKNFLPPAAHADLLQFVASAEGDFVDSTVSTGDPEYRQSKILHHFPRLAGLFRERLRVAAPQILQAIGMAPFDITQIECQLTAHNHGNYFKRHNDNGSPDTATRVLSYVYYFNREPKAFDGGLFRLFSGDALDDGGRSVDIEPENNSILFFASQLLHEVTPVTCPSQQFMDGRFTVNGWFRR